MLTLTYASGWVLKFPKHGLAPMLFLEWIEKNQPKFKNFINYKITTVPNPADKLSNDFEVRWAWGSKEQIQDCYEYIKLNSK